MLRRRVYKLKPTKSGGPRYRAAIRRGGCSTLLGTGFESPVDAAVAYARAAAEAEEGEDVHNAEAETDKGEEEEAEAGAVVQEAEGWRLHLSNRSSTGYKGRLSPSTPPQPPPLICSPRPYHRRSPLPAPPLAGVTVRRKGHKGVAPSRSITSQIMLTTKTTIRVAGARAPSTFKPVERAFIEALLRISIFAPSYVHVCSHICFTLVDLYKRISFCS